MIDDWLSDVFDWLGATPCFCIYGKVRRERTWRKVRVYATSRQNQTSRWPLWRGTCITWTSSVIVVGLDFARGLLREQAERPASHTFPVEVVGGRLHHGRRPSTTAARITPRRGEILAHECGHTWQALRLGPAYLPLVGAVTLFREGPHAWNHFENEASAAGQFGGIVPCSVCSDL